MMPYTYTFLEIAFTHSFPLKKITFFDTADGWLETKTRKQENVCFSTENHQTCFQKIKYALKLSENAKNSSFIKTQQKSTSAGKNNYIDWCVRCSETKTRKRVLLYQKSSNLILKKHL